MSPLEQANFLRMHGFVILPLVSSEPLVVARELIKQHLPYSTEQLSLLSRNEFHEAVEYCQKKFSENKLLESFVFYHEDLVSDLIGSEDISWVSVMKLRAVRPSSMLTGEGRDYVGLHRESLYATSTQVCFQYNCWIPLSNVASTSGMWFVPKSHIIPDEDLDVRIDMNDPIRVERYSAGHRIGLPYQPKNIEHSDIIRNSKLIRFEVPPGHFVVFSAMLIHGGGRNDCDEVRFSMDTGAIPTKRIEKNSSLFAAGGMNHYRKFSK